MVLEALEFVRALGAVDGRATLRKVLQVLPNRNGPAAWGVIRHFEEWDLLGKKRRSER